MGDKKKDVEIESAERPNSTEISVNAKGQYAGKVKVYAERIDVAYAEAVRKAELLEALISSKNAPEEKVPLYPEGSK